MRVDNWHDTMRLTLLRLFGKHNKDIRRLLVLYCEKAHSQWLHQFFRWNDEYSFHKICARIRDLDISLPQWRYKSYMYYNDEIAFLKKCEPPERLWRSDEIPCEACCENAKRQGGAV